MASQIDLLVAKDLDKKSSAVTNGVEPLTYNHALSAVIFSFGDLGTNAGTVTVSLSGINNTGTYSYSSNNWTSVSGDQTFTLINAGSASDHHSTDFSTLGNSNILFMLPQTLAASTQKLNITYVDGASVTHAFSIDLKDIGITEWSAGHTYKYTISTAAVISNMTISYPTGWTKSGGGTEPGPVTAYSSGDECGLFAVDASGKIVMANMRVPIVQNSSDGNKYTKLDLTTYNANKYFSSNYSYYLYYPYQTTLSDATLAVGNSAPGNTADTFFANVISGWEPADDQSSGIKSSDLQVAKYSGTTFTMTHEMGLLAGTIPAQANADNVITYDGNTYDGSASGEKWTRITSKCTTIAWNASTTFTSSTNTPYKDGSILYYVAKPGDETINISATAGTQLYAWSVSGVNTTVSDANKYQTFTIATPDYSNAFNKKVWQFDYSSTKSAKTWVAPHTGTYSLNVWGAQGGTETRSGFTAYGGKGAYIGGNISLNSSTTLYVYVGEQPSGYQGGWNGGGTNNEGKPSGGGGATDISVRNGNWDSETHLYSRIIVAGGGGGSGMEKASASTAWCGGAGGAFEGENGQGDDPGKGGKLNAGGANGNSRDPQTAASFGKGGSNYWVGSEPLGGGGGGWYGGGAAGGGNSNGGGGGGSSYVWTTDASMHTYYPSSSYKPSTSYYLSSIVSTAGSRSGHGQAQIIYTKP